jgi:tRNA1(Val) A37 N6-methylase TrmN6
VSELLRAARVGPWSTVLDIGCGDARVPLAAVRDFGAERGIGVESLPDVYERAVANRDQTLSQQQQRQSVELHCADFSKEQDKAVIEDCLDRQLQFPARLCALWL